MGVNHGGADLFGNQKLLGRSDDVACLKQMCGKGILKGWNGFLSCFRGLEMLDDVLKQCAAGEEKARGQKCQEKISDMNFQGRPPGRRLGFLPLNHFSDFVCVLDQYRGSCGPTAHFPFLSVKLLTARIVPRKLCKFLFNKSWTYPRLKY